MKWKVDAGPDGIEAALDRELKNAVGVGYFDFRRASAHSSYMPKELFQSFVDQVDRSGVVEELTKWDQEKRKSNVGRKALISFRAVLVIELMTVWWNKGVQYQEIANTIAHRLTRAQFEALGIKWERADEDTWYHRHWRAKSRILQLVDPYHRTKKNRRLPLAEAVEAVAAKDEERENRLRWMIQALVNASIEPLPQRYRDAYAGDVALDSTRIKIQGRIHSRAFTLAAHHGRPLDHPEVVAARRTLLRDGRLTNTDFTAGTYRRPNKPTEPAHELDFVTMMDAAGYDEHPAFARLITAVSIHRPGAITEGPRHAMQAHSLTFEQRGIAAADRAFNGLDAEDLQQPLRLDYWEFAFDYKRDEFGHQGSVPGTDIIIVDGAFYVAYMPKRLIRAVWCFKKGKPDPETGELYSWSDIEDIIEERRAYQMKRHGSMKSENKHGAQRFTYPDPSSYRAFDPATGKSIPSNKNKLRGSILIRPDASFLKHLQRYPWGTPEWAAVYGQRNQVESSNAAIKRSRVVNIEDPQLRSGRGVAFHGLASAVMVVIHNIRALVRALVDEYAPTKKKVSTRSAVADTAPTWTLGGAELDAVEPPDEVPEAA